MFLPSPHIKMHFKRYILRATYDFSSEYKLLCHDTPMSYLRRWLQDHMLVYIFCSPLV